MIRILHISSTGLTRLAEPNQLTTVIRNGYYLDCKIVDVKIGDLGGKTNLKTNLTQLHPITKIIHLD